MRRSRIYPLDRRAYVEKIFIADLHQVLVVYGVFGLAYLANMTLSLYQNIVNSKENFNLTKLRKGLVQFVVLVFGTLLLVISVDLLVNVTGLNQNEFSEVISVAAILLTIGMAIVKYIKEAYITLQDILNK